MFKIGIKMPGSANLCIDVMSGGIIFFYEFTVTYLLKILAINCVFSFSVFPNVLPQYYFIIFFLYLVYL